MHSHRETLLTRFYYFLIKRNIAFRHPASLAAPITLLYYITFPFPRPVSLRPCLPPTPCVHLRPASQFSFSLSPSSSLPSVSLLPCFSSITKILTPLQYISPPLFLPCCCFPPKPEFYLFFFSLGRHNSSFLELFFFLPSFPFPQWFSFLSPPLCFPSMI